MAHSRIDDLRRRVEADPASIAFAQLAEECRRAGQTEEAVRICRDGLTRHPGYLSARVTLGRALLDLGQLDEARAELQFVASEAPENLAAVRGLAEIFHREGDLPAALEHFQRALSLARHDPELEEIVQQLSRQVGAEAGSSNGLTFEEAHQELLSAAERVPLVAAAPSVPAPEPALVAESAPATASPAGPATAFDFDTLVAALGTPPAPPLVEAVVSGETPEVFALPDIPAEGSDPFAVLEAELRAQGDIDAAALDDQVAALVDGGAVPADEVAVGEPADDWPGEMTERPPADVDRTPAPGEEPATDAPWLATRLADETAPEPVPVVEWGYAEVTVADAAPPTTPPDEPHAPAEPVLVVEGAFHLEVPAMPSEEPVAPAEASGDPLLAGVEEALRTELETDAVGPDAVEQLMAGLTATVESPPAVVEEPADARSAAPEAPVVTAPAAQGDDVLGDLEDWLSTLQDRSSGQ